MKYFVMVVKDKYYSECGVELAGVFDDAEKANTAKKKVEEWLENEGFEDYEVFITQPVVNHLSWYNIDEDI